MKRLTALLLVLLTVAMVAGCGPSLQNQLTTSNPGTLNFNYDGLTFSQDTILVRASSMEDLEKAATALGTTVVNKEWFGRIGWAMVAVPFQYNGKVTAFINLLRSQKGVLLAEPDFTYQLPPETEARQVLDSVPQNAGYSVQWGFKNINAEAAWDITTGDPNVIVTVVDTGIDSTRPEFTGKIIDPKNCTGVGADNDVADRDGHGTHVAGIAAADPNAPDAVVAGVAWDCKIMPVRVMNDSKIIYTSYLINAMLYVGDYMQAHPGYRTAVNMSIGGRGYSFAFKDAIDYAAANNALLICSMGNDSKRVPQYPSAYNGVVAVAASTPYDAKASFSTTGWWASVAAPGVQILSTYKNGYAYLQGTSMATPFVTGAAALLLSVHPELTPLEVKNQLEQTARGNGFSEALGYGILDLPALLGQVKPMQYGGLKVTTGLVTSEVLNQLGVITVYDGAGRLVAYGTTGEDGSHTFHALKPGTYRVNVSHFRTWLDDYKQYSSPVTITAGSTQTLDVTIEKANATRASMTAEDIDEATGIKEYTFTLTARTFIEMKTSYYLQDADTMITLKNSTGDVLAVNDDYSDMYSYLGGWLEAGTYTLRVEAFWNGTTPPQRPALKCHLDINSVTFN